MEATLMSIIGDLTAKDLHQAFAEYQFRSFKNDHVLLMDHILERKKEDYDETESYLFYFWPHFNDEIDAKFIFLAKQLPNCTVKVCKILPDSERDVDDGVTGEDETSYIALVSPVGFPMFKSQGPGNRVIALTFKYL